VYPNSVGVLGLALADRPGVRIAQADQPIGDHPVARKPLIGLPQQPTGEPDRLLQLTHQPPKPPIVGSAATRPAGVADHRLHLAQGLPGQPGDLAGQPVHLDHRLPTTTAQRMRQLPHPPPRRPAPIPEPGPAGRPTTLDAPHQPTQLAHRLLQQVGVGRVVDVGLHHQPGAPA
jgi:hypothetical protein